MGKNMDLQYRYEESKKFPHWIEYTPLYSRRLDISNQMDINQWCADNFGELGISWGFYYEMPPAGANLLTANYLYSWRFLNEADAMLFKLTFHS